MFRISIITPVYNGKRFAEFCLQNVIDQDCPQAEHLIVDGGSTDGTVEIIKQFADRYTHIRWISEKDRGQSDAMNKGLKMASSEIVGFLNVDDYYEPNVLNKIHSLFESLPEPSIAVGNCNVWKEDKTLWFLSAPSKLSWRRILSERYHDAFPMNSSSYFYHRSLHEKIGLYDVTDHYSMDVDFIIRALQAANAVYCNEVWGNYRYLPGTKTYHDDKTGSNARRLARLTLFYRAKLPLIDRMSLAAQRNLWKVIKKIQG